MSQYHVDYVDSYKGEVTINGIPVGDLDRTGHWSIWKIHEMFQAARSALSYSGNMFNLADIFGGKYLMFLVQQNSRFGPSAFNLSPYKPIELKFTNTLVHVGNTSLRFVSKLTNGSTGEYFGETSIALVRVDRETRRPTTFPDWYKTKYSKYIHREINSGLKSFPKTPDSAHRFKTVPRHSHTDYNIHVNQARFLEYCLNCGTDAAVAGYYRHYDKDMCYYPVLEMDMYYIGESVAGDLLDICTWQEARDDVIYFMIQKKDKNIFCARFVFGKSELVDAFDIKSSL